MGGERLSFRLSTAGITNFIDTKSQTKTVWKLICLCCRSQGRLTGRGKRRVNYNTVSSSVTNPQPPVAQRAVTAKKGWGECTDTTLITAAMSAGTMKPLLTFLLLSLLMLLQPVNWAVKQMGGK